MAAMLLIGIIAYGFLPVSALPEVDYPTIQVSTFFPGASPDVMIDGRPRRTLRSEQFGEMPGLSQDEVRSVRLARCRTTLAISLDLAPAVAEQVVTRRSTRPPACCRPACPRRQSMQSQLRPTRQS